MNYYNEYEQKFGKDNMQNFCKNNNLKKESAFFNAEKIINEFSSFKMLMKYAASIHHTFEGFPAVYFINSVNDFKNNYNVIPEDVENNFPEDSDDDDIKIYKQMTAIQNDLLKIDKNVEEYGEPINRIPELDNTVQHTLGIMASNINYIYNQILHAAKESKQRKSYATVENFHELENNINNQGDEISNKVIQLTKKINELETFIVPSGEQKWSLKTLLHSSYGLILISNLILVVICFLLFIKVMKGG